MSAPGAVSSLAMIYSILAFVAKRLVNNGLLVLSTAFGLLVTALLSSTMVVAGLKAGITPGVSPLVILCAWGAFAAASRGTHFTTPKV